MKRLPSAYMVRNNRSGTTTFCYGGLPQEEKMNIVRDNIPLSTINFLNKWFLLANASRLPVKLDPPTSYPKKETGSEMATEHGPDYHSL